MVSKYIHYWLFYLFMKTTNKTFCLKCTIYNKDWQTAVKSALCY